MPNAKITLSKPLELPHGKRVTEVELKEPTGGLFVKLGEPRVLVFNASGSGYWVPQQDAIRGYFEELIVHELGGDLVRLMSLEDTLALQEELFDFFTVAAANVNAKRAAQKSTDSSSASVA